jgi:flagellar basal-body rod modification protein FlgD
MPVSTVSNSNTAVTTTDAVKAKNSLASNYDTFLKLLTTQLKNQDPLNPMDSTQFTSQLVQYSMVEQQIGSNDKLQKLLDQNATNQLLSAATYIGKTVEIDSPTLSYDGGGEGNFAYAIPSDAVSAYASIYDANSKLIDQFTVDPAKGRHEESWDGKASNGVAQTSGQYKVSITAVNAAGKALTVPVSTYGTVTNVTTDSASSSVNLILGGGAAVPLTKILSVTDA